MKKLVSLIACLLCAAMLATIGFAADAVAVDTSEIAPISNPGPDAYTIYQRASKNLNGATSIEMSGTARTVMQAEGISLGTVIQNSRITMLNLPDGNLQMEMKSVVKTANDDSAETSYVEIYYKDGYMYTKAGDETAKMKLDIEEAAMQASSFDTELTRDMFKDATVEETDEGTRINFTINLNDIKDFGSLLGDLTDDPNSNVKIGDISYSMLVGADNNIKGYDMAFDMDMTVEGVTINTKSKTSYTILSINRVKAINFPDGLAAY